MARAFSSRPSRLRGRRGMIRWNRHDKARELRCEQLQLVHFSRWSRCCSSCSSQLEPRVATTQPASPATSHHQASGRRWPRSKPSAATSAIARSRRSPSTASPTSLVWADAPWTGRFRRHRRCCSARPGGFRTRAKMLWDDNYLYVHAELREPHVWGNVLTEEERDRIRSTTTLRSSSVPMAAITTTLNTR